MLSIFAHRAVAQQGAAPARSTSAVEIRSKTSQVVIDASITDDPTVDKLLEPYRARVRELDTVIGSLEGELKKSGMGGGSLGNFVADGMRSEAAARLGQPVALAITNRGGLRKEAIAPGELRVRDIFELLPFENKLVVLELTGEQVMAALRVIATNRDVQSGAVLRYRTGADKKTELISASLVGADGNTSQIGPATAYRVVTIDYLLDLSGGRFPMLRQAKSMTPTGLTIRDALINYVKRETSAGRAIKTKLDGRFVSESPGEEKQEAPPQ